jgi:hypothetical protein
VGNTAMLGALLLSGGVVSAALGALQSWLRLRFLRHVYDRGGPADLGVAGAAVRSIDGEPPHESKASDRLSATRDKQLPNQHH